MIKRSIGALFGQISASEDVSLPKRRRNKGEENNYYLKKVEPWWFQALMAHILLALDELAKTSKSTRMADVDIYNDL